MTELIVSTHENSGTRKVYEDRGTALHIITPAGLKLSVALIADGVGGQDAGEAAAQKAQDVAISSIKHSTDTSVPDILYNAVISANTAVYRLAQELREKGVVEENRLMATTLTIAAVHHEKNGSKRLFVVNVGDSRVYLLRGQKLTQLTIDHSYQNIHDWPDEISEADKGRRVKPDALMRAIGVRPSVKPDIGFYVGITNPTVAAKRGEQGLPLEVGDSILVCSDGLIKSDSKTHKRYCADDEIIDILSSTEGLESAKMLTSKASGRLADDNVTVALIQMPDTTRQRRQFIQRYRWAGAIIGMLLVGVFVAIAAVQSNAAQEVAAQGTAAQATVLAESTRLEGTQIAAISTQNAESTNNAATVAVANAEIANVTLTAQAIASFTPTPTPQPLSSGSAGVSQNGNQLVKGERFTAFEYGSYLNFTARTIIDGQSSLTNLYDSSAITFAYLFGSNGLILNDISNGRLFLTLEQGGSTLIVLPSGGYSGVELRLQDTGITVFAEPPPNRQPTCLAMDTRNNQVTVGCYGGTCNLRLRSADTAQPLSLGTWVSFSPSDSAMSSPQSITSAQNSPLLQEYRGVLRTLSAAHYRECLSRFDPRPTATPTPLLITAAPSSTPLPQPSPIPPTNVPPTRRPTDPPPTDTPQPTATPQPSLTPVPPSLTPVPPSLTPTDPPQPTKDRPKKTEEPTPDK